MRGGVRTGGKRRINSWVEDVQGPRIINRVVGTYYFGFAWEAEPI